MRRPLMPGSRPLPPSPSKFTDGSSGRLSLVGLDYGRAPPIRLSLFSLPARWDRGVRSALFAPSAVCMLMSPRLFAPTVNPPPPAQRPAAPHTFALSLSFALARTFFARNRTPSRHLPSMLATGRLLFASTRMMGEADASVDDDGGDGGEGRTVDSSANGASAAHRTSSHRFRPDGLSSRLATIKQRRAAVNSSSSN